jgi:hypothetical protein
LSNHQDTGETLVRCGEGVLALKRCRYEDDEEEFAPGRRFKSIRARLSVRVEDWLWELSRKLE